MPIYGYQCSSCGHQKDVLQKISDPVLTTCPQCEKETYSKQVSAPNFQLKGSGWYVTDFRDGNKGGQEAKSKESGSEGAGEAASAKSDAPSDSGSGGATAKDSASTASASSSDSSKSASDSTSSSGKSASPPASGGAA